MKEDERWTEICKPKFLAGEKKMTSLSSDIKDLTAVIKESNGHPSLLSRMSDAELAIETQKRHAQSTVPPPQQKTLTKVEGPFGIKFSTSDRSLSAAMRVVMIMIGVALTIWIITGQSKTQDVLTKIHKAQCIMNGTVPGEPE